MKIGILTVPFNNNYGGFLQAFALMKILRDMGHEPCIIMRRHNKVHITSIITKSKIIIKSIIKSLLFRNINILLHPSEIHYFVCGQRMQDFVKKHILPQTDYFYTWGKLKANLYGRFDAIIVGSDQVWRAIYVPEIENYFLAFTKGWKIKRLAYAASFGTNTPEYTDDQIIKCGELIKDFNAVSVREKGAQDVFKKFGWNVPDVKTVLDPTFLLDKSVYEEIVKNEKSQDKRYVFYYVLDDTDEIESSILSLCNKKKLTIERITDIQKPGVVLPSVESWLNLIRKADCIVTDSFHGMVFSIIFNKPFVVLVNQARGADRFISLLSLVGLSDQLCFQTDEIFEKFQKSIDWATINTNIAKLRKESIDFLNTNLVDWII